jgi:hypothetical protein
MPILCLRNIFTYCRHFAQFFRHASAALGGNPRDTTP